MLLSEKVNHVISTEGIQMPELMEMLRLSSPLRNPRGNRRFHAWGFQVDGLRVVDMFLLAAPPYTGTGVHSSIRKHNSCEGQGCRGCSYWGSTLHFS